MKESAAIEVLKSKIPFSSIHCDKCLLVTFCVEIKASGQPSIVQRQLLLPQKRIVSHALESFRSLYAVQSGILKSSETEIEGREHIRDFYFPGEIIGFEAIHTGFYPFAIKTLTDTIVCEIPFERLLGSISAYAKFQQQLFSLLSRRINLGGYVTYFRAEQRIAGFLIDFVNRLHYIEDKNGTLEFILLISRENIANYLQLAPETVIRLIKRLDKQDIIRVDNKKIKIIDLTKLRMIAQGRISESNKQPI